MRKEPYKHCARVNGNDKVHVSIVVGKRYLLKRDPMFFSDLTMRQFEEGIRYFWLKRGINPDLNFNINYSPRF